MADLPQPKNPSCITAHILAQLLTPNVVAMLHAGKIALAKMLFCRFNTLTLQNVELPFLETQHTNILKHQNQRTMEEIRDLSAGLKKCDQLNSKGKKGNISSQFRSQMNRRHLNGFNIWSKFYWAPSNRP